jgi:hypothetical protein
VTEPRDRGHDIVGRQRAIVSGEESKYLCQVWRPP